MCLRLLLNNDIIVAFENLKYERGFYKNVYSSLHYIHRQLARVAASRVSCISMISIVGGASFYNAIIFNVRPELLIKIELKR